MDHSIKHPEDSLPLLLLNLLLLSTPNSLFFFLFRLFSHGWDFILMFESQANLSIYS
jgi:hypothetical protein